jgi:AraC family transcriptional regulator, transcriptional activator of pobA
MQAHIRISHLSAPFVYRKMEEIEASRKERRAPELPHRHDFFTIIVMEKAATGTHQIDFKNYALTPNTLYFIAPEQVHSIDITEGSPEGHVLMFTHDFLYTHCLDSLQLSGMGLFFNCDEARPIELTAAEMQRLHIFFEKIAAEFESDSKDRLEALGAWLKLFLMECKRLKSNKNVTINKLDNRKAEIVRRFKEDVETNFRTIHQVSEYAKSQNLTSNYLNEIIKLETGSSAKDFILSRLILEAKRLARYSDLTAKEIAFSLGYEDAAQFSKFFKKEEGISFSEFKNEL